MSDQAWSKEPWEIVADRSGYSGENIGYIYASEPYVECPKERKTVCHQEDYYNQAPGKEDMIRIVACVNALAGVPKPEGIPELIRLVKKYNEGNVLTGFHKEHLEDALRACGIEP